MSRPSRVSVGNLLNHTTSQSNDEPVPVAAQSRQVAPPAIPPQSHPRVYRYTENGRDYYAVNGQVAYPFPCDELEDERLDMFYHLIHDLAFSGRLYHAELRSRSHRSRVLDLGHGTGIWAYEMAKGTQSADVIGIDLLSRTPPRPDNPIPNASFMTGVDFLQPNWPFPLDSFDMIRLSQLCGSVPDWWSLYSNISRYLRPGIGYVEHIEFDWTPRCVDGASFPQHAAELLQWWRDMQRASHMFGKPVDLPPNMQELIERCGFTDITHRTYQIPLFTRKDFEPKDDEATREHAVCFFLKVAMSYASPVTPDPEDGQPANPDAPPSPMKIPQSFEALTMSYFTRQLGMQRSVVEALCDRLRHIVNDRKLPMYFNLHVWTARRPRG